MSLKSCKSVYSGISLSMKKWDFIVLAYGYAVDYRYSIPPQYGCVTMTPTCKDGHACGDKSWLFQISHEDEQPISAHNTAEQTQDMSHVFMKAWVLLTEHPLFQFLYVQWSAPGYRQTVRLTRLDWTHSCVGLDSVLLPVVRIYSHISEPVWADQWLLLFIHRPGPHHGKDFPHNSMQYK